MPVRPWIAVVVVLSACAFKPSAPAPSRAPSAALARPARAIRTTSGQIFERNLESRIAGLESRLARSGQRDDQLALAGALHTRGSYRGSLDDLARSVELATEALAAYPEDASTLVLRARSELSLHLFADARRDLASAAQNGATRALVLPLEAELEWAAGDYESAVRHIRDLATLLRSPRTLTRVAVLEHSLGRFAESDARFVEAEQSIEDPDPLAVAWMHVQWGKCLMDRGALPAAEEHLREAVRRLPAYVLAREHLAECLAEQGETAEAVALYESVVATSRDPEFEGALSELYRATGRAAEADALAEKAGMGFRQLLERHPAAMMWHAAAFFGGPGNDKPLALELLTSNVALRPNSESLVALANAQLEAGRVDDARTTIERALRMPPRSAALSATASRAYAVTGGK